MKTEAWTRILHTLATITRQAGEEILERITTPVNLTVLPDGGNQSSPHLWGIMFEVLPEFAPRKGLSLTLTFAGNGPFRFVETSTLAPTVQTT